MQYICSWGTCTGNYREDDAVIGVVDKISFSMILHSAFVICVDVLVTREDAVIFAVG